MDFDSKKFNTILLHTCILILNSPLPKKEEEEGKEEENCYKSRFIY